MKTSCFSSVGILNTTRGLITMNDLRVGDEVYQGDGSTDQVYTFLHRDVSAERIGLLITAGSDALEITFDHLVELVNAESNFVTAGSLKVGDKIRLHGQPTEIASIDEVLINGIYAPATYSGTIVVNGITASNYAGKLAESIGQTTVHRSFAPLRMYGLHDIEDGTIHPYAEALQLANVF